MAHYLTIKKAIFKTKKQITKQKNKFAYSKDTKDKLAAKSELDRLRAKLSSLQEESNRMAENAIRAKET